MVFLDGFGAFYHFWFTWEAKTEEGNSSNESNSESDEDSWPIEMFTRRGTSSVVSSDS